MLLIRYASRPKVETRCAKRNQCKVKTQYNDHLSCIFGYYIIIYIYQNMVHLILGLICGVKALGLLCSLC
jgi:hypothetical protein